jgi:hypothetical protein
VWFLRLVLGAGAGWLVFFLLTFVTHRCWPDALKAIFSIGEGMVGPYVFVTIEGLFILAGAVVAVFLGMRRARPGK